MDKFFFNSVNESLDQLKTTKNGLSKKEAARRLKVYGPNQITDQQKNRAFHILWRQVKNPMMVILSVAIGLSFMIGEVLDAAAIALVMVINVGIGFAQEYKAEKALEALKKITAPTALVLRDGQAEKILASECVPGDILILEEGMRVPADARIIEARSLSTLEASLTGESTPVEKSPELRGKPSGISDCTHMVFWGTTVNQGHGTAVVLQTGMKTEFGKIAASVAETTETLTPMQKNLNTQLKDFTLGTLCLVTILVIFGLWDGQSWQVMSLLAISLGVSIIPEGLPAVITLTLALGVQKMAEQKAAIRKLGAAETLGGTDVICTDKTGTLTQNQMTVRHVYLDGKTYPVNGQGYEPFPSLEWTDNAKEDLLLAATLCNNANLLKGENGWEVSGDPTEGALLTLAAKGGIDLKSVEKKHPRLFENIFDSDRKRMSTVNGKTLWMKGAAESVVAVCENLEKTDRQKILAQTKNWAKKGFRVLAFAKKIMKNSDDHKEMTMHFIGLVAMMDPPREGVRKAIQTCHEAGIRVIMITGDHALTAQAIGEQIGICTWKDTVITGEDIEKWSSRELEKALKKTNVIARVSPKHKVELVEALKRNKHIVAMTGDGINDAPALKHADIGIAMGITGTDVAKEASDMVLLDDRFETIVVAVERGRIIQSNIQKSIRFLLAANFCELALVSGVFIGTGWIPFIPLQILWMNLLTDTFPALALGMDKAEKGLMQNKPIKKTKSAWDAWGHLCGMSALSLGVSLLLFTPETIQNNTAELRNFLFTSLVIFQLGLALSARFENRPLWSAQSSNIYLGLGIGVSFGFQYLAMEWTALGSILETHHLSIKEWGALLLIITFAILSIELWKWTSQKFKPSK